MEQAHGDRRRDAGEGGGVEATRSRVHHARSPCQMQMQTLTRHAHHGEADEDRVDDVDQQRDEEQQHVNAQEKGDPGDDVGKRRTL